MHLIHIHFKSTMFPANTVVEDWIKENFPISKKSKIKAGWDKLISDYDRIKYLS